MLRLQYAYYASVARKYDEPSSKAHWHYGIVIDITCFGGYFFVNSESWFLEVVACEVLPLIHAFTIV